MPLNRLNNLFKKKAKGQALNSLLSMGNPVDSSLHQSDDNRVPNGLTEFEKSSGPSGRSMWTISGLHSHRNVKPSHQMLLAENMFEESVALNMNCRFNKSLDQIVLDNNIFPYFIQYMESMGNIGKCLIRFWIQTECLTVSQKNVDSNVQKCDQQNCFDSKAKTDEFKKQFMNDSIGIFDKYLSQASKLSIEIPEDIKTDIQEKLVNNKPEINYDLFSKAQTFVLNQIEADYYESFMKSTYYCKYEVDVLTSGSVHLADILFNNSRLATNFIEFMESEGMKPYIDFLIMFENYRKFSNDWEDAIAIYNRFLNTDNVTNSLGFSENLRQDMSEKVSKDSFSSDCFDRPAAILIQYFEKTYLKQFLESELYFEYLTYCIQSIQMDLNHIKKYKLHKRTNSDSSYNSESSFVSSIGTRDGDNVSNASPAKFKHKSSHLSDDQRPDSLWKRDLSGKLQFTHIDKYGRISSCLEPEPDRHSSGTFSKVMKKLNLNSSDDKDKEEIAWKIARMIVNDVCSATQELSHNSD